MSTNTLQKGILTDPVVLLGIPTEFGAPTGSVTLDAPGALRKALPEMLKFLGLRFADLGDINCPRVEEASRQIPSHQGPISRLGRYIDYIADIARFTAEKVRDSISRCEFPVCVGGDHSISFGTEPGALAALKARLGSSAKLGVVQVDAHLDMHRPETSNSGNPHGMPMAALMGYGHEKLVGILGDSTVVEPQNMVCIGGREIDQAEMELAQKNGVNVFTMEDIRAHGLSPVLEAIAELRKRVHGVWFNLDIDGLEPRDAPGTGMPCPDGVTQGQLFDVARLLVEGSGDEEPGEFAPLVGMEIAEFSPGRDPEGRTKKLLLELIALLRRGDYSYYARSGGCAPDLEISTRSREPNWQIQDKIATAEAQLQQLICELESEIRAMSPTFKQKRLCGARLKNDDMSCLVSSMLRPGGHLDEWVAAQDLRSKPGSLFSFLPTADQQKYFAARHHPFTAIDHPYPEDSNHLRLLQLRISALEGMMAHGNFWREDENFERCVKERKGANWLSRLFYRVWDYYSLK